MALGWFPLWARLLLRLRNALVKPFGVQSSRDIVATRKNLIGFFPILSASDRQVVLGFDDSHLDFRLVVDVIDQGPAAALVAVTTLVHRKNLFGRIYIAVVTPFHRLIVRRPLAMSRSAWRWRADDECAPVGIRCHHRL